MGTKNVTTPPHLVGHAPDGVTTFASWRDAEFQRQWAWLKRPTKADGATAVLNGCFDLFHLGHANLLRQIAAHREYNMPVALVVLVNSDDSVRRLKGARRPYVSLFARMAMVTLHPIVRMVAGFEEDTPEQALSFMAPDVLFKGAEYQGTDYPEQKHCGRTVYLKETPGYRTTGLSERLPDPGKVGFQHDSHASERATV